VVHVWRHGAAGRGPPAQHQCHIRVDLFYAKLSDRQRAWLDLFGLIVFLWPFCFFMVLYSWPWFVESWLIQETSANAGGLLRWPVKALLPLGLAC
jgi:TRAP-type mannitol/chloroaromatic compound transport system permease small subunit